MKKLTRVKLQKEVEKLNQRIARQDRIMARALVEINGLEGSLASATMFSIALMKANGVQSAEFTREQLNEIVEKHHLEFSEIKNEFGKISGVKIQLKLEDVADAHKQVPQQ